MITTLFNELNEAGIQYCHFKSNTYLEKAFSGKTDFDLLVSPQSREELLKILKSAGAKIRYSSFNATYEGTENFLLYDASSESMFHFHLHYSLIYGAPLAKNHCIRNTKALLNARVLDQHFPIFKLSPQDERSLLVHRMLLKLNPLSLRFFYRLLVKKEIFEPDMLQELNDLSSQLKLDRPSGISLHNEFMASKTVENIFLSRVAYPLRYLAWFLYAKRSLLKKLRPYERQPASINRKRRKVRKLAKSNSIRWTGRGGFTISLIGSDGSGKSTLKTELERWINYKLNCHSIYLGRPKTPVFKYLSKLPPALRKIRFSALANTLTDLLQLAVARQRLRLFREGIRYSNAGYIVLFERFPLSDFDSMEEPMDGPRIPENRWLSKFEKRIYSYIEHGADINLVLSIDASAAIQRKPEHQLVEHKEAIIAKTSAIRLLTTKNYENFFALDASQQLPVVVKQCKEVIWNNIK